MTLAELLAAVIVEVGRPDLSAYITSSIKAETLAAHSIGVFDFDLVSTGLTLASEGSTQAIDTTATLTNFREIRSIQIIDSSGNPLYAKVPKADPGQVVDNYGYLQVPCWFQIGNIITVRSAAAFQYVRLLYRKFPTITDAGYDSKIAEIAPYYLVQMVAAKAFGRAGKAEEARSAQMTAQRYVTPILEHLISAEDIPGA